MITEFSIDVDNSKDIPSIEIKGEIDIYTCTKLRETLANFSENKESNLILNLESVQYIDSTGLGTIAHTAQKIEQNNGTIYIICNKPQIKKIFEVSGLLRKNIEIHETETQLLNKTEETHWIKN